MDGRKNPPNLVPPLAKFKTTSTGLIQEELSSSGDSPGPEPRTRPRSISKAKDSPTRISVIGSPVVAPPSPKRSPKGSPKIIKHSDRLELKSEQEINDGEFPLFQDEAIALLNIAKEKFKKYTDDQKIKEEKAEHTKQNGYSIEVKIKKKAAEQFFWLVVTGNYRSGSIVYLVDTTRKLGDGANADIYLGYDLSSGNKTAVKALHKKRAAQDFLSIEPDIAGLILAQRFCGVFWGDIGFDYETYLIFMPFVPGRTLIECLYKTNQDIKKTNSLYKDLPEYYQARIVRPYLKRFDLGIAIVAAVQLLHENCIIHRDISGDNLLVDETAESISAELVDFDEMVDMGCDIFSSTTVPVKDPDPAKDNLSQFVFDSNAAYIRVGNELCYLNKHYRSRIIVAPGADLDRLDIDFKITEKPRRLSYEELKEIARRVGHIHTPPRMKGLRVPFGYGAPELIKDQPEAADYKADIYQMGVLLLDSFDDEENLQQEFKLKCRAMMVRSGFRPELSVKELKEMAPSVFEKKHPVDIFDFEKETLDEFASRYIYQRFMLPKIRKMLEDLLSENPEERLYNSSLQELHKHLSDWRKLFVQLAAMLKNILSREDPVIAAAAMKVMNAIAIFQDMGFRLKKLVPCMQGSSGKLGILDDLLKEKEAEPVTRSAITKQPSGDFITLLESRQAAEEDALQAELQRVREKHHRRIVAFAAMQSQMLGWENLQDTPNAVELLESLAKCLFHTGKSTEVIDFIKQLKPGEIKKKNSQNSTL